MEKVINNGGIDVGEQLEFVRAADVVTVAGSTVGNNLVAVLLLDLPRLERQQAIHLGELVLKGKYH